MKRFRVRAFLVAAWLFVAAFAAQLAIRHLLSARTLLSPDAVVGLSFGAEAVAFLLVGFLVSFLARGFGWRELGAAAVAVAAVAFLVLHRMKPPSFSYDKFFADTRELVLWAGFTGLGAWLLGLWGAGLVMHAWEVWFRRPITEEDIRRELQRHGGSHA